MMAHTRVCKTNYIHISKQNLTYATIWCPHPITGPGRGGHCEMWFYYSGMFMRSIGLTIIRPTTKR